MEPGTTALTDYRKDHSWVEMVRALRTPDTKEKYEWALVKFFQFLRLSPDEFVKRAADRKWAETRIADYIDYQKARPVSGNTVLLFLAPVRKFCAMNDLTVNWEKIRQYLPLRREWAADRAPTTEELKRLVEGADLRLKVILLCEASGGWRVGAWPYLRVGDFAPVEREGKLVCARVLIYRGEREEYVTFITPEAYQTFRRYLAFREAQGEKVSPDSAAIVRKPRRNAKMDSTPVTISPEAIGKLVADALRRTMLRTGKRTRYEWKALHGWRKYYKSRAQQTMKPVNVEFLLGHRVGLEANYYRPTEEELMLDYLKAVDSLTVFGAPSPEVKDMEKRLQEQERRLKRMEAWAALWQTNPEAAKKALTHARPSPPSE